MHLLPDPDCPHCGGVGIVDGDVNKYRTCECTTVWEPEPLPFLPILSAATLQRFFAELEDFLLTSGP